VSGPDKRRVLLIRHGESTFNALYRETGVDPQLVDAPLSPFGERQVAEARARFLAEPVELVVTTPFTRAIQTAKGLFGERRLPFLVEALHRERVSASCDLGRSPKLLTGEFPDLDFAGLADPWWYCHPAGEAEPLESVHERIAGFRDFLRRRPERCIAVVGHSAFFFHMTGHVFQNCECLEIEP